MVTFVLVLGIVEAALELVPEDIAGHPAVVAAARARGRPPEQTLLDESLHHPAMENLPDRGKRGRPDIVHRCLLSALDSVLNREGHLALFLHTYNDQIVEVNPKTRLPRRFTRFVGLMEQLLQAKRVPPRGPPLLRLRGRSLAVHLRQIEPSRIFLLAEDGDPTPPGELADQLASESLPLVLVGGFAHGDFTSTTRQLADKIVRLDPDPLPASTAISMVIHALETKLKLAERRFRRAGLLPAPSEDKTYQPRGGATTKPNAPRI